MVFTVALGLSAGQGAAPVLGREVMRCVLGLVGREQGRSARGRRNESKKTHIVIVLVLIN